jgi:hypothetical protein
MSYGMRKLTILSTNEESWRQKDCSRGDDKAKTVKRAMKTKPTMKICMMETSKAAAKIRQSAEVLPMDAPE